MGIYEKLQKIQLEMKAPKNLYNSFGKYNYRNCEAILEAFKPYGEKYKVALTVSDMIHAIGDRIFIQAIATFIDTESGDKLSNTAYAEIGDHKGMSADQITGCASSYARKYCLNGLFLLDDTKDADTDEVHRMDAKAAETKKPEAVKEADLRAKVIKYVNDSGMSKENVEKLCKSYKVESLNQMTAQMCQHYINLLKKNGKEIA